MQTDGNLVSYRRSNGQVCFKSDTYGHRGAYARLTYLGQHTTSYEMTVVYNDANLVGYGGYGPAPRNVSVGSTGALYVAYAMYGGC